jgi:cytochrome c-type biogenesis protein CcmH/NrfF
MGAMFVVMAAMVVQGALPQGQVQPRFSPAVEREASKIFNSTMSPFCPGLLIANCPSPGAAELKDQVREALATGITPDSIRAELLAVYGEEIRATPAASGIGLVAWVVPGLGLLVAGVGIAWWLRRADRKVAHAPAAQPLDPEAEERLEHELTRL